MTRNTLLATLAVVLGLSAVAPEVADARPRPQRGKTFEANKTFGLGLELGAPTGLTGKYFLSQDRALQFGLGTIYHWRDRDGLNIYLDYLFHPLSLTSNATFELPLYFGFGGRIWDVDDYRFRDDRFNDVLGIGLRVPVGIAFDFNNVPLDIFIQLAFVLDFYTGDYDRNVYGDVNGSFGIRYWFD
ncbi:MAG: hypothetical protein JWP01_3269 [Myxococcales bacterium]|nr:hypothetical protein [Myxococcales bacterium]